MTSFSWLINGSTRSLYEFQNPTATPSPLDINPPLVNIMATVNVSRHQSITNTFDIISILRANDVSVLNGTSIQCESSVANTMSNLIFIQVSNTRFSKLVCNKTLIDLFINNLFSVLPPSPLRTSCSLVPSSEGAEVTLQWPSTFIDQYGVERYRVSVNPDPSICSRDYTDPSEVYNCTGLDLEMSYTFTISAVNCGDQEGGALNFTVPQLRKYACS